MVIIYEFKRTKNKLGLSWGRTRRFKNNNHCEIVVAEETLPKTGEEQLQKNENKNNSLHQQISLQRS
jgi:hypothetical protein